MLEYCLLKIKDSDSPETTFKNIKQLIINFDNYTIFKDGEKCQFQLGPTGDVRLLRLTLKGMSCMSGICEEAYVPCYFFIFLSRSRKKIL